MKETIKQIKMGRCSHYKASLQKPGYTTIYKNGLQTSKGKMKCPTCGYWWIDEKEIYYR